MTVPPFFSKQYLKGFTLLDRIGFSTIKWSACDRSSIFNKNLLYHNIYKVKKVYNFYASLFFLILNAVAVKYLRFCKKKV